jgi:hypothetical protein
VLRKTRFSVGKHRAAAAFLQRLPGGCQYEEWEGAHNFEFFDTALARAMELFFGGKGEEK